MDSIFIFSVWEETQDIDFCMIHPVVQLLDRYFVWINFVLFFNVTNGRTLIQKQKRIRLTALFRAILCSFLLDPAIPFEVALLFGISS